MTVFGKTITYALYSTYTDTLQLHVYTELQFPLP